MCEEQTNTSFEDLYKKVIQKFPDVDNIFTQDGVTKQTILMTIKFIALATHHEIKVEYPGGHSVLFYCGYLDISKKGQQTNETISLKKPCKFYLCFVPKKKDKSWVLKQDDKNCIPNDCCETKSPSICMNEKFITILLHRHLPFFCSNKSNPDMRQMFEVLERKYLFIPKRPSLYRGWCGVCEMNEQSLSNQKQKVESYLRYLNKNGQYGVVLYSNGELVVPSNDGKRSI